MIRNTRAIAVAAAALVVCAIGIYAAAVASPSTTIRSPQVRAAVPVAAHVLRPAPPVMSMSQYPYGTDNGETVWIDSSDGPQTVKMVPIAATTAGSPNALSAAVTGQKERVLGLFLTSSAAGTVQFVDTASNNMSGVITLAANGQVFVPVSKFGIMETATGAGINLTVTGTSNTVGGWLVEATH